MELNLELARQAATIRLLKEIIVDWVGLLCYAMLPDGKLCQEPLHSIFKTPVYVTELGRRQGGDWIGRCQDCMLAVHPNALIDVSDVVAQRQ